MGQGIVEHLAVSGVVKARRDFTYALLQVVYSASGIYTV
jgi:hypothetical protein